MEARHHVPLRERQARHPSEHLSLHLRRALRYSLRCLGLWASCEQAGRASENCSKSRWMTITSAVLTVTIDATPADWIAAGRVIPAFQVVNGFCYGFADRGISRLQ